MSETKIVGRIGIEGRQKPPARRVYGDGYEVVVGGDKDGVGGKVYLPHAGEWFDVSGGISLEMYERQTRMQLLRGRQMDLQRISESYDLDKPDSERTPQELAEVQRMRVELSAIATEVGAAVTEQRRILAELIPRWTWSDQHGNPLGEPTGIIDEDSGLPICVPDAAAFGKLEMVEAAWLMQQTLSDNAGNEGN